MKRLMIIILCMLVSSFLVAPGWSDVIDLTGFYWDVNAEVEWVSNSQWDSAQDH